MPTKAAAMEWMATRKVCRVSAMSRTELVRVPRSGSCSQRREGTIVPHRTPPAQRCSSPVVPTGHEQTCAARRQPRQVNLNARRVGGGTAPLILTAAGKELHESHDENRTARGSKRVLVRRK